MEKERFYDDETSGKHYVYQTTNKINGKIYVGVHRSDNIEKDNYLGSGKIFLKALEKYGKENFERVILFEFDTAKEAYEKEREIINEEFIDRDDTYNTAPGGHGGVLTKENPFKGKHHSEETKRILSEKSSNKRHTEEIKQQISETLKERFSEMTEEERKDYFGRPGEQNGFYEKTHSEETRKIISEKNTGRIATEEERRKMSEAGKGRPKTEEFKKLMSEKMTGRECPWVQETNRNPEKIRKTAEKHRGMKRSDEAKENMSKAMKGKLTGSKNGCYIGLWHTPYGTFDSLEKAANATGNGMVCVRERCMKNERKITRFSILKDSKLTEEDFGKTWKELGWWLERKVEEQ